jgi:hypothetical protein
MNDTMSLILATSILAIGGLGMYMYKNSTEDQEDAGENDDGFFGSNFFSNDADDNELEEDRDMEDDDDYDDDYKPRSKRGGGAKTKRNKKAGGTKRRY